MAGDTARLNRILLRCSRGAVRLWRNSVGLGWVGKSTRIDRAGPVHLNAGDVVIRNARPLHAGLFKGSGDLIGAVSVVITPEMVGRTVAVFASVEDKGPGDTSSPEQKNWAAQVRALGGIAGEVRSVEDAERLLAGDFGPVRDGGVLRLE